MLGAEGAEVTRDVRAEGAGAAGDEGGATRAPGRGWRGRAGRGGAERGGERAGAGGVGPTAGCGDEVRGGGGGGEARGARGGGGGGGCGGRGHACARERPWRPRVERGRACGRRIRSSAGRS